MVIVKVTPCVGVWIETEKELETVRKELSHPAWVCGLKLVDVNLTMIIHLSHPAWVCGLKLARSKGLKSLISHTLRGCVD